MRFEEGTFCTERGFYCQVCKHRNDCNLSAYIKPLGLESKDIWLKQRKKAILEAMERYTKDNEKIPEEWVKELNELIEKGV